ncbi:MAG TPA: leucine--tRNA ligase [Candidatus Methanoperedens sp.]|nr:leucine--tRNA ligase [Candidatus Methanoperedens sp.]
MDFRLIEDKWQRYWDEHLDIFCADINSTKEKKYILVEFPYPSGSGLHVGHAFSFTGSDVYARFKRMQGYNVLFPMGWDAFGLPTENYAIKSKRKPQDVTKENTEMFKSQMKRLAYSFDWNREINTTDPNYYRWTQWIFIQLFNKGLAYKKEMPINWCPSCKIGLANEEVIDNKCERCGNEVERRNISQWVVKITEYADKLVEGLDKTDFIEKVKQAQINWIGKSEGARVGFKIKDSKEKLEVFTTRPDTLYGVTFMVIAPEHKLALSLGENNEEIKNYLKEARKKSEMERTELNKEKTGVFSGVYAINPINNKEIPIWISDFVLSGYGTGAIMSVPAHDERDFAFAKKFNLEIIPVIKPEFISMDVIEKNVFSTEKDKKREELKQIKLNKLLKGEEPYVEAIGELFNSEDWNGLRVPEKFDVILEWLKNKGIGEKTSTYHLRDWIFSRQHYWGEPIPMIYCKKDGWQPVPEKELPVLLPEVEAYEPTEDGKSPLSKIKEFVNCKCPLCGGDAQRETDTMPNWAGSDWYYLAYCVADKLKSNKLNDIDGDIFSNSQRELKKWCPVDVYVGGDEHNTLHLLYSRFIYQFLYDIGVIPKEVPEPYYKRMSHGVILGSDNQRMSKSKGNVIVPETVADVYGVDVIRMYLMFMGPFDGTMAWNEKTLMGVKRFLERFKNLIDDVIDEINWSTFAQNTENEYPQIKVVVNKKIDKITKEIEHFSYNTAIASMMELLNEIREMRSNPEYSFVREGVDNKVFVLNLKRVKDIVRLIAPFAPYTAEELWYAIWMKENNKSEIDASYESIHVQEWPDIEKEYLVGDKIMLAVAVNGKVREQLEISSEKVRDEKDVLMRAKSLKKLSIWLMGKKIVKEIYVPGKMVNFVLEG